MTVMFLSLFIFSVIKAENLSLSTESAPPAGTLVLLAASTHTEESISISAFKSPAAELSRSAFSELEHTSSAKFSFLCAGENFFGFIS